MDYSGAQCLWWRRASCAGQDRRPCTDWDLGSNWVWAYSSRLGPELWGFGLGWTIGSGNNLGLDQALGLLGRV
ncbi:hypothetical protein ACFX2I_013089 [Malus domestica]